MLDLSTSAIQTLKWLGDEDFSQYGECHGPALDELIDKGLAQVHDPGEHQSGFIAQDPLGDKDGMYRAVSLTETGITELLARRPKVV